MHASTKALLEVFEKADISHYIFEEPFIEPYRFDFGLRRMLIPTGESPYEAIIQRVLRLKEYSLYQLTDVFFTHYALFKLPDEQKDCWLSVGPVLVSRPTGEQLLSLLKQLHLPVSYYHELQEYYERLPQLEVQEALDRIYLCIADSIFCSRDQYVVKYIHNSPEPNMLQQMIARINPLKPEDGEEKKDRVQLRYDRENEFLKSVKTGDIRDALKSYYNFMRSFGDGFYRMSDRLRDLKDIGITLNTLLRKVAQEAGVHPFYIDSFSNANIIKLEQFTSSDETQNYYRELIMGYCNLIQEYALNHYSQPIQSVILMVQSDLTADLSLSAVAQKLNISRNYLSDLFHRETGEVLSTFVLKKRIQQARHLLSTTSLPVQDIAWEVGIPDANYFSRLFRRETGHSPKFFRGNKIDKYET